MTPLDRVFYGRYSVASIPSSIRERKDFQDHLQRWRHPASVPIPPEVAECWSIEAIHHRWLRDQYLARLSMAFGIGKPQQPRFLEEVLKGARLIAIQPDTFRRTVALEKQGQAGQQILEHLESQGFELKWDAQHRHNDYRGNPQPFRQLIKRDLELLAMTQMTLDEEEDPDEPVLETHDKPFNYPFHKK